MPLTANCIYNAITTGERLSGLTRKFGPPGFDSAIEKAYPEEPKGALPPITRAHFQEPRRLPSYFALFETLSLYARRAYYTGSKTRPKNMEKVEASAVRQAIIAFIHQEENLASCEVRLDAEDANSPDNLMDVRLKRRKPYALKLVGYHIDGDLDLSNLNFKGSIRLIGCVVTGALILDRCELITLDLSGSVIKHGISGMYLSLRGALRCRRLVSESAIDFGGLSALGTVDFTDAVISPENDTSTRASYVRDRGILNLAQSDLKRDLRMERARIYGGINLRAAHIGGMFHLNDALLRSPLAHFEYILLKTLTLIAQKGNEGLLNEAGSLEAAKKHPSWVQLSPTFPQSLSHGAVEAIAAQLHPDAIDK